MYSASMLISSFYMFSRSEDHSPIDQPVISGNSEDDGEKKCLNFYSFLRFCIKIRSYFV